MRRGSSVCYGAGKETSEAGFSAEELNAFVDLRVFMDPAPHTISELAPMASVYHLFNLMGARHLPVFNPNPNPGPNPNPSPSPSPSPSPNPNQGGATTVTDAADPTLGMDEWLLLMMDCRV